MIFLREKSHKSEPEPEQNLIFNISYYPAFQNVRIIIEELRILLTPNKEHKKVFPIVSVIEGFGLGRALRIA